MCSLVAHHENFRANHNWFFDVSNAIEEVSERGCYQVDHGDELAVIRYPRALARAAWKRPLRPSMRALLWGDVQR